MKFYELVNLSEDFAIAQKKHEESMLPADYDRMLPLMKEFLIRAIEDLHLESYDDACAMFMLMKNFCLVAYENNIYNSTYNDDEVDLKEQLFLKQTAKTCDELAEKFLDMYYR